MFEIIYTSATDWSVNCKQQMIKRDRGLANMKHVAGIVLNYVRYAKLSNLSSQ